MYFNKQLLYLTEIQKTSKCKNKSSLNNVDDYKSFL